MSSDVIIYFDVAAVIIMLISLASLFFRNLTRGASNRMYLSAMILVTLTALAAVGGEACEALIAPSATSFYPIDTEVPLAARGALATAYYALRSLTTPAYLVLIATVSDTSHRLDRGNLVRFLLWVPMSAVFLLVITNPIHHLVFSFENNVAQSGPLMIALYLEAIYYSAIGVGWLIRWKSLLSNNEFATLMLLYPIMIAATIIQHEVPGLRLEMFVTSIAMSLVSAFVIHSETRYDSLVNALNLHVYREMCRRAFITNKSLCLVYVEIVNIERLRELVGKIELQEIMQTISENLSSRLEPDDTMYYLHNGLFCISPRNLDPDHALSVAWQAHNEGKAKSDARQEKASVTEMRSCLIRVPEDAPDLETLKNFGKRFAHLVPMSTVTTFQELAKRDDFELQMALSGIIGKAIAERSFDVYYQPIYCLSDGRFHSAEALVRLSDPKFGWVPPSLFIPEAEQSGTILAIGEILLQKICAFLGEIDYEEVGLSYVEVNLSVDQCVHPELTKELLGLLDTYNINPVRLNLEITETSAAYSQQAIEDNVRALATAGITVSLDDFGTGYSNMTRMLSLPFTLIKIDKSFVDALDDFDVRTMLSSTVTAMKEIGKDVLVEGVETREQADAIASMGVDYIQGYYYAEPLSQDQFITFLKEHNA